jgi:alpha-tubulin suppressor-like RCC1 family protein
MHWTRPTSASGYGGFYFAADHGTLSKSDGRLTLRSAEYGDFEAKASGRGTLVVDYYLGETLRRWRFVKNGMAEDPKNAAAPGEARKTSPSDTKWIAVDAGAYHACALAAAGAAYCWGLSAFPEGSAGGSSPQPVAGGLAFASITAGSPVQCDPNRPEQSCENNRGYHVCALTPAGEAYCWGVNRYGQLGDGTTNDTVTPVRVGGGLTWESLSAGEGTTCGITTAHALYCWGRNDDGQLGVGTTDNTAHSTPQPVAQDLQAVTVGSNYVCALRQDGAAYCWGNGGSDRLGTSAAIGYGANPSPQRVESNSQYVRISAGRTHVCATTGAGAVECWGDDYYGESGPGSPNRLTRRPTSVGNANLTSVEVGRGYHSCALGPDGAAYCWGLNDRGRLGIGAESPEPCGYEGRQGCSSVPVPVKGNIQFKSLSAGLEFTCGISTAGDAYCWGDNQRGQLGTGDRKNYSAPRLVVSP